MNQGIQFLILHLVLSKSEPSIKNELLPVGKTDGNSLNFKKFDVDK